MRWINEAPPEILNMLILVGEHASAAHMSRSKIKCRLLIGGVTVMGVSMQQNRFEKNHQKARDTPPLIPVLFSLYLEHHPHLEQIDTTARSFHPALAVAFPSPFPRTVSVSLSDAHVPHLSSNSRKARRTFGTNGDGLCGAGLLVIR